MQSEAMSELGSSLSLGQGSLRLRGAGVVPIPSSECKPTRMGWGRGLGLGGRRCSPLQAVSSYYSYATPSPPTLEGYPWLMLMTKTMGRDNGKGDLLLAPSCRTERVPMEVCFEDSIPAGPWWQWIGMREGVCSATEVVWGMNRPGSCLYLCEVSASWQSGRKPSLFKNVASSHGIDLGKPGVLGHPCNPSTWEMEAGVVSLGSRILFLKRRER